MTSEMAQFVQALDVSTRMNHFYSTTLYPKPLSKQLWTGIDGGLRTIEMKSSEHQRALHELIVAVAADFQVGRVGKIPQKMKSGMTLKEAGGKRAPGGVVCDMERARYGIKTFSQDAEAKAAGFTVGEAAAIAGSVAAVGLVVATQFAATPLLAQTMLSNAVPYLFKWYGNAAVQGVFAKYPYNSAAGIAVRIAYLTATVSSLNAMQAVGTSALKEGARVGMERADQWSSLVFLRGVGHYLSGGASEEKVVKGARDAIMKVVETTNMLPSDILATINEAGVATGVIQDPVLSLGTVATAMKSIEGAAPEVLQEALLMIANHFQRVSILMTSQLVSTGAADLHASGKLNALLKQFSGSTPSTVQSSAGEAVQKEAAKGGWGEWAKSAGRSAFTNVIKPMATGTVWSGILHATPLILGYGVSAAAAQFNQDTGRKERNKCSKCQKRGHNRRICVAKGECKPRKKK